jgi:hypothetical protein
MANDDFGIDALRLQSTGPGKVSDLTQAVVAALQMSHKWSINLPGCSGAPRIYSLPGARNAWTIQACGITFWMICKSTGAMQRTAGVAVKAPEHQHESNGV